MGGRMIDQIETNRDIYGHVSLYTVAKRTNDRQLVYAGRNLITYQGTDMLTKLLVATADFALNGMYAEYQNTAGVPAAIAPARADTAATVDDDADAVADADYMRFALSTGPGYSASAVEYAHNRLTLHGLISGSVGVNGVAYGAGNNSKIRGLGLVHLGATAADDLLFARASIAPAVAIPSGLSLMVQWVITLL